MTPSPQLLASRSTLADRAQRVCPPGSLASEAMPRRPAKRPGPRSSRARVFRDAQAIIQREYGKDLAVEALARSVLASRRQLQRAFTEAGTTVRAELTAVRMKRAAELLLRSSLSVREVACLVGYRQPAHFADTFRRGYGVTPSQYRKGVGLETDLQPRRFPWSDTTAASRRATSSSPTRHPPRGEPRWQLSHPRDGPPERGMAQTR
jgi:AraC family transcriptional regulator, regulatory protein of adaptative response / methylphosphotriester-DNA alkyltransferase methyltransferase